MTKRANPYVEDYVPQSKVYIGLKQLNNNEDKLKQVYEKTLKILYQGAKKIKVPEVIDQIVPLNKDKMKQLIIDKNGALVRSGETVQRTILETKTCACGSNSEVRCAYCEKDTCSQCSHRCVICENSFCSRCSLSGLIESKTIEETPNVWLFVAGQTACRCVFPATVEI